MFCCRYGTPGSGVQVASDLPSLLPPLNTNFEAFPPFTTVNLHRTFVHAHPWNCRCSVAAGTCASWQGGKRVWRDQGQAQSAALPTQQRPKPAISVRRPLHCQDAHLFEPERLTHCGDRKAPTVELSYLWGTTGPPSVARTTFSIRTLPATSAEGSSTTVPDIRT